MTEIKKTDILNADEINSEIKSVADELDKLKGSIKEVADASMKLDKQMKTNQKTQEQVKSSTKEVEKNTNKLTKVTLQVVDVSKTLQKQREKEFAQRKKLAAQREKEAVATEKAAAREKAATEKAGKATLKRIGVESQYFKQLKQGIKEREKATAAAVRASEREVAARQRVEARQKENLKLMGKVNNTLTKFGLATLGLAAAFRVVSRTIRKVIDVFSGYSAQLSKFRAISGATEEEMKQFDETAKDIGKNTIFTAKNVAELGVELAKLGFAASSINNVAGSIVDLATAADADLGESAKVAASTLKGFELQVDSMGKVVDVMALSFSSSALDLEKFKVAMATVAPVAKNAEASLERTTAVLSLLVDRGLEASTAGTSLRNIFLELADQGITWNEAMEKINTSTNKNATALDLFGKRSATAATIIAANAEELEELNKKYENAAGAALRMSKIMQDNLVGDAKAARSALEALSITIGESLNPDLRNAVQIFTELIRGLDKLVAGTKEQNEKTEDWFKTVKAIILPLNSIVSITRKQLEVINEWIKSEETLAENLGFNNDLLEDRADSMVKFAVAASEAALERLKELELLQSLDEAQDLIDQKKKEEAEKERLKQAQITAEALIELQEQLAQNISDDTQRAVALANFEYEQKRQRYEDEIKDVELRNNLIEQAEIEKNNKIKEANDKAREDEKKAEDDALKQKLEAEKQASAEVIKTFERESGAAAIAYKERVNALKEQLIQGLITEEQFSQRVAMLSNEQAQAQIAALKKVAENESLSVEDKQKLLEKIVAAESALLDKQIENADKSADAVEDSEARKQKAIEDRINAGISAANEAFNLFSTLQDREISALESQKAYELSLVQDNAEAQAAIEQKFADETAKIKRKQAIADKAQAIFNIAINTAQGITAALATANIPLSVIIGILGGLQAASVIATPIPQFDEGTKATPDTYIAGEKRPEVRIHKGKAELLTKPTLFTGSPGDQIISGEMTDRMLNHGLMDSMRLNGLTRETHKEGLTDQKLDKIHSAIMGQKAIDVHINRRGVYSVVRGHKAKSTRIDKYFS